MDVERRDDGHWHFTLGPVERWVVAAVFTGLVTLVGWTFNRLDSQLDRQGSTQQQILTQQAVTNSQLQTLSQQLSDVPSLTRQMAEMQVQVKRNTQDIHELQQVRGLK